MAFRRERSRLTSRRSELEEKSGTDLDEAIVDGGARWLPEEKDEDCSMGEKDVDDDARRDGGADGCVTMVLGRGRGAGVITTSATGPRRCERRELGGGDTTSTDSSTFRRFRRRSPIASSTLGAASTTGDEAVGRSGTTEEPEAELPNSEHPFLFLTHFWHRLFVG